MSVASTGSQPNYHILSVLVQNRPGVLASVSNLFARRGYNIFSLAVAPTEDEALSRITIVVDAESAPVEQVVKQLFKLIEVIKISELDPRRSVERIPIKVAILNNSYLGMVRQWQEMFYEERYSEVYLSPELPDFVKWSDAMGCVGIRVDSPEEVQPAIDKANSVDDRPVVVDFRVDAREKVFPMVPAGMSNDDLVLPDSQESRKGALR